MSNASASSSQAADSAWRVWIYRGVVATLLGIAYFGIWREQGRGTYVQHLAAPILHATTGAQVTVHRGAHQVVVKRDGSAPLRHRAPAGFRFLLPALAVALIAPHRPYIPFLFAGHLVLALVSLAALALGVSKLPLFLYIPDIIDQYLVSAFSLSVAAFALIRKQGWDEALRHETSV